uniref:GP-PDE domain-containing protein n=2 Tax=Macrostomum lignano TaxID=282301 RepID=A0A1I8HTH9_9PLAT
AQAWYLWTAVVGGCLLGYATISCLLLRYPSVLHRRKRRTFAAAHISHRGGAGELAENTMEAFRAAVEQHGTHMLELDCQMTRDGCVVVAHDEQLDRLCGCEGRIDELDYDQLPPISARLGITFSPGAEMASGTDRRIPKLEEVLRAFPGLPMNVDVKFDRRDLMESILRMLREHNRLDVTVWGNWSHRIVTQLARLEPRVPRLFSLRRIGLVLLLFVTGLLPFVPISETHYEPPMPSVFLDPSAKEFWRRVPCPLRCLLRGLFWVLDCLIMSPMLIGHLRLRGIPTFAWVANTEEQFVRAFRAGCEGVMTDYPCRLRAFIDSNPWCLRAYNETVESLQEAAATTNATEGDRLIKKEDQQQQQQTLEH